MLAFIVLSLLSPLLVLAQETQHTNITAFPPCALTCITAGVTAQPACWTADSACATTHNCADTDYGCLITNNCGYTNDTCVCTDIVFADAVANCTTMACDPTGRAATAQTANSQCASIPGHVDFTADSNGTVEVTETETPATTTTNITATSSSAAPTAAPYTGGAGKIKMVAGFMFGTIIGVVSALILL